MHQPTTTQTQQVLLEPEAVKPTTRNMLDRTNKLTIYCKSLKYEYVLLAATACFPRSIFQLL